MTSLMACNQENKLDDNLAQIFFDKLKKGSLPSRRLKRSHPVTSSCFCVSNKRLPKLKI